MNDDRLKIINLFRDSKLETNDKLRPILSIESSTDNIDFLNYIINNFNIIDNEYGLKAPNKKNTTYYKLIKNSLPPSQFDLFFLNNELDFLSKFRTEINTVQKSYFIKSLNFYSETDEDKKSEEIFFKYYNLLILLKEIIESISDDKEPKSEIIIYSIFYKGNIKVENKLVETNDDNYVEAPKDKNILIFLSDNYKCNKIANILHELIKDVNKAQNDNSDYKINIEFLKKSIYDQFKEKIKDKKEIYFYELIEKLEQIYDDYELIKRAYIDSLNPDKLKDDFQKKYQEALTYLNSILTDIHTKTLFIPIAIILSILPKLINNSSKSSIKIFNYPLLNNYVLFILGAALLGIIFYFMLGYRKIIKNIGLLIKNLKEEVNRNKNNTSFYDKITEQNKNLSELFDIVKNRLYFSYILVSIGIIFLFFIFIC
ncbi:MAG: hypothetical protein ACYCT7_03235 [bacterium]